MAQVLTSEQMPEFIATGKVPEFVAPDAKTETKPEEVKAEADVEAKSSTKVDEPEDEDGLTATDAELTERIRKKIGAKHRRMKEAEEFAEAQYNERRLAEKRAEQAETELSALKSKATPQPGPTSTKPDPKDFPDAYQWAEALAEYKANEAVAKDRAEREETQRQQAAAREQAELESRVAKLLTDLPDFHEVIATADVRLSDPVLERLREDEEGLRVAYYLAQHPDTLDRISKLTPARALTEIGKLTVALEAGGKVKEFTPSPTVANTPERPRAPAPIKPLDGKSSTVAKDPSEMSFKELRAYNESRRAQGRRS